ncbi:MAG: SCO family protein [Alphaproteobacteria bacterium]|nr:SCO family protein [Alphaproteobacteria bacterium]
MRDKVFGWSYAQVMNFKHRLQRFFVLAALGLVLGALIGYWSSRNDAPDSRSEKSMLVATSIGGAFSLVDQDGIARSEKDYAGKYLLIYFGFTYCPAICPTELSKITEAYLSLPEAFQEQVQPIFVTIDPERDTPDVLKGYVGLFMPQLVGLTGTIEQIEEVKRSFKVYAAKVPDEGGGAEDYTMDHTSLIYLFDPEGHVVAMFKTADTSDDIQFRLIGLLKGSS